MVKVTYVFTGALLSPRRPFFWFHAVGAVHSSFLISDRWQGLQLVAGRPNQGDGLALS